MTQADCYREAYPRSKSYKAESVASLASRLMSNVHVKAIVDQGRAMVAEKLAERRVLDQTALIERWTTQATVDRNELMQIRRVPCRFCYGRDHRYQETPAQREARWREYERIRRKIEQARRKGEGGANLEPFDELGGVGYTIHKEPHPECPECFGEGEERVHFADTRNLSPEARELYEGVEMKRDGMVLKIKDRAGAEDNLARTMGLFVNKNLNLNWPTPGGAGATISADPMEAAKDYQRLIKGEGA
jgi:hypothetical protein